MPKNISLKWQKNCIFVAISIHYGFLFFVQICGFIRVYIDLHFLVTLHTRYLIIDIFIIMICFMIVHIYPIWIWQFLAVSKLCWYLIRWWLKPRSWTQLDKTKYIPDFNIFFEHSRPGYWYLIPQTNRCPTLIRPILCSDCFLVPT